MVKNLPKLTLLVFLFCLGLTVHAQNANINLTTLVDEPVTYSFLSRNTPTISSSPDHGDAVLEAGDLLFQYVVTYTPDPGFQSIDQLTIFSFPLELNTFAFTRLNIEVKKAEIIARRDEANVISGASVTIPVTLNDTSSTGVIMLESVPAVNAGQASIQGNNVIFTPHPGFVGPTDFDYVICTDNGVCDLGTVSVNVLESDLTTTADTVQVFTKKNQAQFILKPMSYEPAMLPGNGTYDLGGDIPTYVPDADFVGTDYIDFTGPDGSNKTYRIEVLDMIDEQFAVEDVAYTLTDNSVFMNVVENDLYGSFTGCVSFGAPDFGSVVPGNYTGRVTYTPPAGWSGIDRFTYTSFEPGCEGESETQTVYVVVSDFAPAEEAVEITTVSGASIPLTYATPTGSINWSVATVPALGEVVTSNDGQLIYTPSASSGTDQLSITYCLEDDNGGCVLSKTVEVTVNINESDAVAADCADDCVWPGDTNHDGAVDMLDFLTVGLHIGSTGTPRLTEAPEMWCPQTAEDWEEEDNGINRKHVDANGDQIISSLDTQVILNNFGLASRVRPRPLNRASFDIYLDGDIFAEPGDIVPIKINVGAPGNTIAGYVGVEDIFGFRFPFDYDPEFVDPTTVNVVFDENSWMSYDSPVLSTQVNDQENGLLESAYVRTNGKPISGAGTVGTMYVGVEDIFGFRPVDYDQEETITLGGGKAEAIEGSGNFSSAVVHPLEITIRKKARPANTELSTDIDQYLDEKLLAYPNPAGNQLTVHLNGQREFSAIQVTDLTGRRTINLNGLNTNHYNLDLSRVPTGIYTLTVTTTEGVINRKLEVIH